MSREGRHGSVVYRHFLACGHSEVRKRVAPAKKVGCTSCQSPDFDATDVINMERLRLGVAARLKIEPDDVRLSVDTSGAASKLLGAYVFLTADDVVRLSLLK